MHLADILPPIFGFSLVNIFSNTPAFPNSFAPFDLLDGFSKAGSSPSTVHPLMHHSILEVGSKPDPECAQLAAAQAGRHRGSQGRAVSRQEVRAPWCKQSWWAEQG